MIEPCNSQSKPLGAINLFQNKSHRFQALLLGIAAPFLLNILAGCGGMKTPAPGQPIPGESTKVTLFLSSTANAQLSGFQMVISSITLTNQAGKTVAVFQRPQNVSPVQTGIEAIHANADAEPLGTTDIPQDVYTSASVNVSFATISVVTLSTNSLGYDNDSIVSNMSSTVVLPMPVVVTGNAVTLSLDLQVAKSASFTTIPLANGPLSITPVFNLTTVSVAAQPTNNQNGKTSGVHGRVASINSSGSGFSMVLPDGPTITVGSDSTTVFQGVNALFDLTTGMFVDIDAVVQQDGSLRATRVEVEDPAARDVIVGPLTQIARTVNALNVLNRQQQGDDICCNNVNDIVGYPFHSDANTVFRISGQFSNLQSLPFNASFSAATMVLGQNVSAASALGSQGSPTLEASTITLVPQTINGTVNAIAASGGFTVYSVKLAANDLIPTLSGVSNVTVYVGNSTQVIASSPIVVGSTVRFNGLLLNDNGTLRMVAGQVSDGVEP